MLSDRSAKQCNNYSFISKKGLNRERVIEISEQKNEPGWMTDFRLQALAIFEQKPMPVWGGDLRDLDPDDIYYYIGIDRCKKFMLKNQFILYVNTNISK